MPSILGNEMELRGGGFPMRFVVAVLVGAAVCQAQSWSPINVDLVMPMNTSTPGTTLTAAIGNAGTVSNTCVVGGSGTTGCGWNSIGAGTIVGANQNLCSNLGPVQLNNGGTLYPAQSLNYNNVALPDSDNGVMNTFDFNSGIRPTHARMQACVNIGIPAQSNGDDKDLFFLQATGGNYADIQLGMACPAEGQYGLRLEGSGGGAAHSGVCVPVVSQGTYFLAVNWNTSNGFMVLWVYTPQGALVGTDECFCGSTGTFGNLRIFSNENATNSGTTTYQQNIMVEWTSTPSSGTASVTNGSPTVTGSGFSTSWVNSAISLGGTTCLNGTFTNCYMVGAVNAAGTQMTLTSNYSGTSGSAAYSIEQPLFWTQSDPWANVLPPARGIDWAGAGVVGGIPSESWTQCTTSACNTVTANGATSTAAQIQAAVSSAPANSYVLLPAGTYSGLGCLSFSSSNVALRGAGANQTALVFTGTGCSGGDAIAISGKAPSQSTVATVTGSVIQGSNTISLSTVSGLVVGNYIILDQLDTQNDNGGPIVTGTSSSYTGAFTAPGNAGPYSQDGGTQDVRSSSCTSSSTANCYHQQQMVYVTQCDGVRTAGHACSSGANITINPPIQMPNFVAANMGAWWSTSPVQYAGIEDLQVDTSGYSGDYDGIHLQSCMNCWVKGVAILDTNFAHVLTDYCINCQVENSYFYLTQNHSTSSYGTACQGSSYLLIENNIAHATASPWMFNGTCHGTVIGYNYNINNYYTDSSNYNQNGEGDHTGGVDDMLMEGNIISWAAGDNIHGTSNVNTKFRNSFSGTNPACQTSGASTAYSAATYGTCSNPTNALQICNYHRFYSQVGNILRNPGASSVYVNTPSNSGVIEIGAACQSVGNDTSNTVGTAIFWQNWDNVTNGVRNVASDSQTFPPSGTATSSLVASQFPYAARLPVTTFPLPASFYYTSQPSWWPSGKDWPLIGPDVSTGNVLLCSGGTQNGALVTNSSQCPSGTTSAYASSHVTSNPAMDCYLNTMKGPANGVSTSALSFNESSCYATTLGVPGGQLTAPASVQVIIH
jgi:hypothetical protein